MNKQGLLKQIQYLQGEVMSTANEVGLRDDGPEWANFWKAHQAIKLAWYLVDGQSLNEIKDLQTEIGTTY